MNNWTLVDRVLAFVRLARRPVSLVEVAEALDGYEPSVSSTLSTLFQNEELNRTRSPDARGRLRYLYTDPAYDELLAARDLVDAAYCAVSHDCEEPIYTLTTALEQYERRMGIL